MENNLESKSEGFVIVNPDEILKRAGLDICPYMRECDLCHRSETTFEFVCTGDYRGCKLYREMIGKFD